MNLGSYSAVNHMSISHYSVTIDEKPAASRELFATPIERFNRYRRWLDTTDQFWKDVLAWRR
jgi:hypothetical protein